MLRELEEGCDIRIGRLGQMMNGMAVELNFQWIYGLNLRELIIWPCKDRDSC